MSKDFDPYQYISVNDRGNDVYNGLRQDGGHERISKEHYDAATKAWGGDRDLYSAGLAETIDERPNASIRAMQLRTTPEDYAQWQADSTKARLNNGKGMSYNEWKNRSSYEAAADKVGNTTRVAEHDLSTSHNGKRVEHNRTLTTSQRSGAIAGEMLKRKRQAAQPKPPQLGTKIVKEATSFSGKTYTPPSAKGRSWNNPAEDDR